MTFGLLLCFFGLLLSTNTNLNQFFDWTFLTFSNGPGIWVVFIECCASLFWCEILTYLSHFSHVFSGAFMVFVVERAKKCMDFSFTIFFVHLLCCCLYKVNMIYFGLEILNAPSSGVSFGVGMVGNNCHVLHFNDCDRFEQMFKLFKLFLTEQI
jgi:hypothetical protein